MDGKIRVLDNILADQIAAGEVVERPASVVKELLENAIDAGATTLHVTIENGGATLIRVADNGAGMGPDDAKLCMQRHATSKLQSHDDLFCIRTLGFRGEALPSIASVSRLRLTTRPPAEESGTELSLTGGELTSPPRPVGCAPGTVIEVRDLFFNVPARLKFLKAKSTESGHVAGICTRIALAYPQLHLTLVRDGRTAREFLPHAEFATRVQEIFPGEHLNTFELEVGDMQLSAVLGPPERARNGATALHLFVNGRAIKDVALARAVAFAYGSVLPPGRFPIGAVRLRLPADELDVNVHPQKSEVRFTDGRSRFDALTRALAKRLGTSAFRGPAARPKDYWQERLHPGPRVADGDERGPYGGSLYNKVAGPPGTGRGSHHVPPAPAENRGPAFGPSSLGFGAVPTEPTVSNAEHCAVVAMGASENGPMQSASATSSEPFLVEAYPRPHRPGREPLTSATPRPGPRGDADTLRPGVQEQEQEQEQEGVSATADSAHPGGRPASGARAAVAGADGNDSAAVSNTAVRAPGTPVLERLARPSAIGDPAAAAPTIDPSSPPVGFFSSLRYIGQTRRTLLICEGDERLYLIDQHAADERVRYAHMRASYAGRSIKTQRLLFPERVEVSEQEGALVDELQEQIAGTGLECSLLGPTTVAIHAVPVLLQRARPEQLLQDLLAELQGCGDRAFGDAIDMAIATMACHAAVRAGDALQPEEATALLRSLDEVQDFGGHCPHGRPIAFDLPFSDVLRKLGR